MTRKVYLKKKFGPRRRKISDETIAFLMVSMIFGYLGIHILLYLLRH